MSEWIEEAKSHLNEKHYPYIPEEVPDDCNTPSKKAAYAASFAVSRWMVEEAGVDPKRAYHVLMNAIKDAWATKKAQFSELDLPINTN